MRRIFRNKYLKIFVIFVIPYNVNLLLYAQKDYYAGINILAPLTSIPNQYTNLYLPLLSNLENGFAAHAGIKNDRMAYETRIALGKPNSMSRLMQFHIGANYFVGSKFYVGIYSKYYNHQYIESKTKYCNLIPYGAAGYKFFLAGRIYCDLRLNQPVYTIGWSNLENTKVSSGFYFSIYKEVIPVIPYISINIGYMAGINRP